MSIKKEKYEKPIKKERLKELTGLDENTLWIHLNYLSAKNLIEFESSLGKILKFSVLDLSNEGIKLVEEKRTDYSEPMSNAYVKLFKLENRLRLFIEQKLKDKFKSEWWEKGIPNKKRKNAEDRKEETEKNWQVSKDTELINYIEFGDIGDIISKNYTEIFKQYFDDLNDTKVKLGELEKIRNSIAHTRVLTEEGYNRLEQYYNEIMKKINSY